MIPIPAIAMLPSFPMPELAVGFLAVTVLATTATLLTLAVVIGGLFGERREQRIPVGPRPAATPASHARSAA